MSQQNYQTEQPNYQIITGVVITTIVFLLVGFFILMLVAYYNRRKKRFIEEKQNLITTYREELLNTRIEIQEQTFTMISQEIHDNVGQLLSLAKVQLNIIEQGGIMNIAMLGNAKESISKAMADLRDIAKSLNTDRLLTLSLQETIAAEAERVNRTGIITATVEVTGIEQQLPHQKKLILLRITQESLQNIIKHSKANAIYITLCFKNDNLMLQISDNGIGFNTDDLSNKTNGLGLHNIISRARMIGGEATINSIINKGTTLTIYTPYEQH